MGPGGWGGGMGWGGGYLGGGFWPYWDDDYYGYPPGGPGGYGPPPAVDFGAANAPHRDHDVLP